ncbi:hypothetical protein [Bordetella tumulicola]|uniref:hypothetical protein n=1 Tax=Bordetella tumulicola TaxID=1649133 RepID=UPI0039EEE411
MKKKESFPQKDEAKGQIVPLSLEEIKAVSGGVGSKRSLGASLSSARSRSTLGSGKSVFSA